MEIVETREELDGRDGEDVDMKPSKLLSFDPAIVVKLDEWIARVGLLDLVRRLTASSFCEGLI